MQSAWIDSSVLSFSKTSLDFGKSKRPPAAVPSSPSQSQIRGNASLTFQSIATSAGYATTDTCTGQISFPRRDVHGRGAKFQPDVDFAPAYDPGAITVVDSDSSILQVIWINRLWRRADYFFARLGGFRAKCWSIRPVRRKQ